VGLCLVGPDGAVVRANAEWLRGTGFAAADVAGKDIAALFPESAPLVRALHARARGGDTVAVPRHAQRVLGRETWWEGSVSPVPMADGVGTLITARDVTAEVAEAEARAREERALQEANARHARVLESITEAFVAVDRDWRFTFVNRRAAELLGRPADALLGRRVEGLFPFAVEGETYRQCRLAMEEQTPRHFDAFEPDLGRWFENHLFPSDDGLSIFWNDVTERKRTELALREADRRKDEFLAILSHELRNPLAPVRNACSVLERAAPGSEAAERARTVIARQVDHLARLVDDLLDVTRISRGKVRLHRVATDVAEVARRTAEDLRSLFAARRLELDVATPHSPMWVDGDPVRLAQVIGNLLQNAAKFTSPGGHVGLAVARAGPDVLLRVVDDGAGISPDLLGALFQPFTQAERTLERSRGGLGLGLALVKGIVELHGGTVVAHSAGEGRGAEFVVALPEVAAPSLAGLRPAPGSAAGSVRRVLVVEDNADAAASMRDVLELRGHEVYLAGDGPAGIEAARRVLPDLVLCDVGLPGMDGYEVARRLRADPALSGVTLVALTGYATAQDAARARQAGFHHHLTKPADLDAITGLLEGSGARGAPRGAGDASRAGHVTEPSSPGP
jgi:PAS domain S-box-containing protein